MKKLAVLLALMMALTAIPSLPSAYAAVNTTYVDTLFDQSKPIEINIMMEQEAWDLYFSSGNTADYISNPGSRYNMLIVSKLSRALHFLAFLLCAAGLACSQLRAKKPRQTLLLLFVF